MLMENQLQQPLKEPDHEKLRDLCNDIQRFPEAYHKFTSIIHQIQYLNVTTNWTSEENSSNSNLKDGQGILSKAFRSKKRSVSPLEMRNRTMLKLLTDVQQVFNRYHKIQKALEDRLHKFSQLIVKKSPRPSAVVKQSENLMDSEEDDPQRPLLAQGGVNGMSPSSCLEKVDKLNDTLRRTRRIGAEVQDSIEVLHDLISWENKQSISSSYDENLSG
ncbi:unnamed protein product [Orchesella dallaii]|uniref:Uncharacterized protein n=1 Tax=Orchesella dallaii TaxID=48710 RepID=A0ABP1SAU7_9HEXA